MRNETFHTLKLALGPLNIAKCVNKSDFKISNQMLPAIDQVFLYEYFKQLNTKLIYKIKYESKFQNSIAL